MGKSSLSWRWRVAQSLEHRWWRRYLHGQSPRAYLTAKNEYWRKLLAQLDWPVEDGLRVLDAGCGPAGIFMHLHDRQRVTAVDPLLSRYESLDIFARNRYPDVDFRELPLEQLVPAAPFDAIYCINAINHVSDWAGSLDALTAAARPGTRLLLTSDVHRHDWLQPVFRMLPGDLLHPQQHAATDYRTALTSRGWTIGREEVLRTERIFVYRAWVCTFEPSIPAG
ncbi:2-polyprenyl-6-hydroxyphenyl methylase/3-demethylubiquinone-9 3-methyltransferase [Lewinella aquimaris]|uniref:2-polyprenyl-6-hydroxyphenyl methylase/3-demethylubiquinone-9 3-methyltransferase n=1 Tax=Neolewinella aquimaris TaxID=1835722 RepID=A0A840EAW7_9BACT|nr:class I SAM-dependent methyltransferase [Neolewinella aquimaris]MBB4078136.1 2-polyprenyl-6-hydroxyphenyl methylase/3-demethylubiquinone-9 3-methyltransferase [Neolewinella aquimaris]